MKLQPLIVAAGVWMASTLASATQVALFVSDHVLPGQASSFRVLIECFDPLTNQSPFVPLEQCNPFPPGAPGPVDFTILVQNDKALVVRIGGLLAETALASDYDRFVTFAEVGQNPSPADDVLRVQFDVLGPSATQVDLSDAEMTISLISDSLVPGYLGGIPGTAQGQFVSAVNQVFGFGADPFLFGVPGGPINRSLPVAGLFVSPTTVDEPGTLAAALLALGLIGGTVGGRRRTARSIA